MEILDMIHLWGYTGPVVSSLLCLSLLAVYYIHQRKKKAATDKKLLRIMMLYYVSVGVGWINIILYRFFPEAYTYVNASYYLSLLIVQVSFYHLIYRLTDSGDERRFPHFHYAIPCVLVAVFVGWSLFVPFDVRHALVTSRGEIQVGYKAYSLFFTHRFEVRSIYTFVYIPLGIIRLLRYRREICEYSADVSRNSLRWLYMLIALSLAIVPLPFLAFFLSKQQLLSSVIFIIPMFIIVIQHGILCFNMLTVNYIIIVPENSRNQWHKPLIKSNFNAFMRQAKPYLNSRLRISDLTCVLKINRSYLSEFINRNYGMNFSQYINSLRIKELENLRKESKTKHIDEKKLTEQAGFSSYTGYCKFIRRRNGW